MSQRLRKYLGRTVALMCAVIVLAFLTILLNGTLIFSANPAPQNETAQSLYDLSIGETKLNRIDRQLVWVTYLSAEQQVSLNQFDADQVALGSGCMSTQKYCVLAATTQQNGINLQYSYAPPPQLPNDFPWVGGFVNPINGLVYDLLGRSYAFQGPADLLTVVQYASE